MQLTIVVGFCLYYGYYLIAFFGAFAELPPGVDFIKAHLGQFVFFIGSIIGTEGLLLWFRRRDSVALCHKKFFFLGKLATRFALTPDYGARRPRGNASTPPHVHMPPSRRVFNRHGIHAMGRFHGPWRSVPQPIRPCSGLLHRRAALPLLHRASSQARSRRRLLAHAARKYAARHVHKPPPPPSARQVRQARGDILQGNPPSRHRERHSQRGVRIRLHPTVPHRDRKRAHCGRSGDSCRCHHLLGDRKPSIHALLGRASPLPPPSSRARYSSISRLETRSPSWPSA